MIKINRGTIVTFPHGSLSETSKIIHAQINKDETNQIMIFVERTPFHPVDNNWPDQPTDQGVLSINGKELIIDNALTGAMNLKSGIILIDSEINIQKGDGDWVFLVAHISKNIQKFKIEDLLEKEAVLVVDAILRQKISASHTACHLMALALNKMAKEYWKKEVEKDTLGNPNFDKLGIQKSSIEAGLCIDHYRLGKSLRKKGLDTDTFFKNLKLLEEKINYQIEMWLKTKETINIEAPEPFLDSRRWWTCKLDNTLAKIPCGGTHISSLDKIQAIKIEIEANANEPEINILTHVSIT